MENEKRKFSNEFKAEAVKLVLSGDRSMKEVADSLGIEVYHLSSWKSKHLSSSGRAFTQSKRSPEEDRILKLEKENADLKMENAILKKATAIFSRQK